MKKIILFLLCLLLAGAQLLHAQSAGSYLYNGYSYQEDARIPVNTASGNNVTLKAQVMMNVRPTSFTAIFAVSQSGLDVMQVDSLMSQRIGQVIYALGQLGIPESDIHIDAVAMVPRYTQKLEEKKFGKRATEIPIGFEMKKNIHVLFRNHDVLDPIISEMAFVDIYDLVKVEYNIDGIQTYYNELRDAALSVIKTKEQTYSSLKMHLDVISLGDGFASTYPMERYKSFSAYNGGASYQMVNEALTQQNNYFIDGKKNVVNFDMAKEKEKFNQQFVVQVAEKSKTIFYDRMPYNQFDKVINADTEEPCIQLMYNLDVYYTMMTEEIYKKQQEQIELQKKQQQEMLSMAKGKKRRGRV